MLCKNCGRELAQGTIFCTYCGAEQNSQPTTPVQETAAQPMQPGLTSSRESRVRAAYPKDPKSKYLALWRGRDRRRRDPAGRYPAHCGRLLRRRRVRSIEGPGYATPEEAAKAYLTASAGSGCGCTMLAAFAVETYVDHYDFEYDGRADQSI